jgi:hypothetical protein
MTATSVLVFVFIVVPILYWGARLAWWLIRVAYISLLILIHLACVAPPSWETDSLFNRATDIGGGTGIVERITQTQRELKLTAPKDKALAESKAVPTIPKLDD